jgi:hypothetical protein
MTQSYFLILGFFIKKSQDQSGVPLDQPPTALSLRRSREREWPADVAHVLVVHRTGRCHASYGRVPIRSRLGAQDHGPLRPQTA